MHFVSKTHRFWPPIRYLSIYDNCIHFTNIIEYTSSLSGIKRQKSIAWLWRMFKHLISVLFLSFFLFFSDLAIISWHLPTYHRPTDIWMPINHPKYDCCISQTNDTPNKQNGWTKTNKANCVRTENAPNQMSSPNKQPTEPERSQTYLQKTQNKRERER